MLEVFWKRGHDPVLEVMRCIPPKDHKKPPKLGEEVGPVLLKESLSRYSHAQLHYLMQCHGLALVRQTADTPVAESAHDACAKLPEPATWGWLAYVALLAGAIAVIGMLSKWLRIGCFRPGKEKSEDERPVEGAADGA